MASSGGSSSGLPNLNDPLIGQLAEYTRERLRDYPELNRLTAKWDHSPRHLKWAVIDTLSDWASTPPFVGTSLKFIVDRGWYSLFTRGVVITVLESLGILHMRNFISYSDGGMNVQTENPQLIQSWLQMLKNEYEQKKQRALIAVNVMNALDLNTHGVHSELYFVNAFFGPY